MNSKVLIGILKEWMEELQVQSIDLNTKRMNGWTPKYWFEWLNINGWTPILNICSYGHKDVVNRLFLLFNISFWLVGFLPLTFLEVTTLSWKEIDWLHKSLISLYFFCPIQLVTCFLSPDFSLRFKKSWKISKKCWLLVSFPSSQGCSSLLPFWKLL